MPQCFYRDFILYVVLHDCPAERRFPQGLVQSSIDDAPNHPNVVVIGSWYSHGHGSQTKRRLITLRVPEGLKVLVYICNHEMLKLSVGMAWVTCVCACVRAVLRFDTFLLKLMCTVVFSLCFLSFIFLCALWVSTPLFSNWINIVFTILPTTPGNDKGVKPKV